MKKLKFLTIIGLNMSLVLFALTTLLISNTHAFEMSSTPPADLLDLSYETSYSPAGHEGRDPHYKNMDCTIDAFGKVEIDTQHGEKELTRTYQLSSKEFGIIKALIDDVRKSPIKYIGPSFGGPGAYYTLDILQTGEDSDQIGIDKAGFELTIRLAGHSARELSRKVARICGASMMRKIWMSGKAGALLP